MAKIGSAERPDFDPIGAYYQNGSRRPHKIAAKTAARAFCENTSLSGHQPLGGCWKDARERLTGQLESLLIHEAIPSGSKPATLRLLR
ncbi:hypothetical protein PENANT_c459G04398, partial [Penicillium antarcticum]